MTAPTPKRETSDTVSREAAKLAADESYRMMGAYEQAQNRANRFAEALEALIESCADWSNDDIRDHCRAVLMGNPPELEAPDA